MSDLDRTKHYTTESEKICGNLTKYIPADAKLIEPFVGDGDMVTLFPDHEWEYYDIEDKGINIIQDTLKNPPDYKGKWVITNPPFLAQNKATDKEIFYQYRVDDLYKATLISILNCEGGILILPTNFLTDERTGAVRETFLSQFEILEANVFTEPVFKTTTYSVCSFAFVRKENTKQTFNINAMPKNETSTITIDKKYGFRVAGEFYSALAKTKPIKFGRLVGMTDKNFITHMKLYAIDTRSSNIHIAYEDEPFYGGVSDRTYATLTCVDELTKEDEDYLVAQFNKELNEFRETYHDLSMTNYRDYNRKRIGFTFAYQLMTKVYNDYKNK